MPLFKATAIIDGKETEVQLDDAKFIPVEQHNVRVKETVRQRLARQAANIRTELTKDEEFVNDVLKAKGIDPKTLKQTAADGTSKQLTEADVAKLQEEWRQKELTPVQQKLGDIEKRFTESNARTLKAELSRALVEAGTKPHIAARMAEIEASRFGFDEKSGHFAMKNAAGDGFAFSTKATDDQPFKGIAEFATEWAADKANADFIAARGQGGPQLGNERGTGSITTGARATMTDVQKSEYIAKNGFDAFQKLPEK